MTNSIKIALFISSCLLASILAAPTDTTTTVPPSSPESSPPSTPVSDPEKSAPTPSENEIPGNTKADPNATAPLAVSSVSDIKLNNSSFTCYNRPVGYYADVEHNCQVYHFCLEGEYNGQAVYQRISYLCLNTTVFDQNQLDCVATKKTTTPCKESPEHYDKSNAVLRDAILGNNLTKGGETPAGETPKEGTPKVETPKSETPEASSTTPATSS